MDSCSIPHSLRRLEAKTKDAFQGFWQTNVQSLLESTAFLVSFWRNLILRDSLNNDFIFRIAETPTAVFGDYLRQQVEDRLKFYESGEPPRKNISVMKEAIQVANIQIKEQSKKKKKKDKKRKLDDTETNGNTTQELDETANGDTSVAIEENGGAEPPKKKKKKGKKLNLETTQEMDDTLNETAEPEASAEENGEPKKKKKKKNKERKEVEIEA